MESAHIKTEQNVGISLVNGTSDREAFSKRWIAVYVQMNTEKKVGQRLSKLGFENYVPIQREIHLWSDRKKRIERVVIPMVLFVCLTRHEDEKSLQMLPFVNGVVSYPGTKKAAVIPEKQILDFKRLLEYSDSQVEFVDKLFVVGEKVEIMHGPLKGLVGRISTINEKKHILAIQLDVLGYACVNISIMNVK